MRPAAVGLSNCDAGPPHWWVSRRLIVGAGSRGSRCWCPSLSGAGVHVEPERRVGEKNGTSCVPGSRCRGISAAFGGRPIAEPTGISHDRRVGRWPKRPGPLRTARSRLCGGTHCAAATPAGAAPGPPSSSANRTRIAGVCAGGPSAFGSSRPTDNVPGRHSQSINLSGCRN